MRDDDQPAYLVVSEIIKHLKNKNYGLAELALLDLWERLANEHHEVRKQESESR